MRGPGRAACGDQHWGPAEPGLPSPSASGLHWEQQLRRCLAPPESIASLSHRLLAPTPFMPVFRKILETTFPFIFFFVVYSFSGSPEELLGYLTVSPGFGQVERLFLSFGD